MFNLLNPLGPLIVAAHRDPEGRGDIWGLGMTALAVATGQEPLDCCTTRSQVEIELAEAWKEGMPYSSSLIPDRFVRAHGMAPPSSPYISRAQQPQEDVTSAQPQKREAFFILVF